MPGTEYFGAEEKREVNEVLETGCLFRYNHEHLRQGMWKATEMEQEAKRFTGAKFAHAVSSGSTAVTTALAAAGIGYGDEVIVPPFTYLATIEAVIWMGAIPVFADIDETLCLSVEGIKKALTPNTKAICLVHMCGGAADMDGIMKLVKDHNLVLVEDAGQAFGAFYKGTSVGLFGKSGAFSFDFFKITTAGEGGLCITNDEAAYDVMHQISDHGHSHIGNNRGMETHPIFGQNFRISELHAAIGKVQIQKVEKIRADKRANKAVLKARLAEVSGITFRHMDDPAGDSATFLNFFLPTQALAQKAMNQFAADGLAGFNYWFTNMYHFINQWDHIRNKNSAVKLPFHVLPCPQDYNNLDIPQAQNVVGRLISLGIRGTWTADDLQAFGDKMVASLRKVLA